MKILFYSTRNYELAYLVAAGSHYTGTKYLKEALTTTTAAKTKGFDIVCIFTGDDAAASVLDILNDNGVRYIAIRAAGYDHVNLEHAARLGMQVANVPAYSPYAIAEHAAALVLALNRKLILADKQVHAYNFETSNLVGFDIHGKTVGVIGTGRIGSIFCRIMKGFGARLLGYDIKPNLSLQKELGVEYVDLPDLFRESSIISIHTCLTPGTHHMVDRKLLGLMASGTMLINTSRGACVNTSDVIDALESKQLGYYGADVYEHEKGIFFYDLSHNKPADPLLEKLLSYPNVLITPHQGFATSEALSNIADTTFKNVDCWSKGIRSENELTSFLEPASL